MGRYDLGPWGILTTMMYNYNIMEELKKILQRLSRGEIDVQKAHSLVLDYLRKLPFLEIGEVKIDTHRRIRRGFPEIIYGEGKDPETLRDITLGLLERREPVIITRLSMEKFERMGLSDLTYFPQASLASSVKPAPSRGLISVITAGASDKKVAEEASIILEILGIRVERFYDVGVAGLHRLLPHIERINSSSAAIVVAGMEGALPTLVSALTSTPVIGVPTSVGYGASLGGFAALLTMLNSCSNGVAVVNIDNGVSAALFAYLIEEKVHGDKGRV